MGKLGCNLIGLFIIGWILVVWVQASPEALWAVIAGVAIAILVIVLKNTNKTSNAKKSYAGIAQALNFLADNMPIKDDSVMALNKDEAFIYKLQNVGLTEYRSTGSTYSGGSQGVSFRVTRGVYYRVGGNRGSITKNPETLQIIDYGTATFTSQRIIFVGQKLNREWDFSKLLDVHVEANGTSVSIAVSGKEKNSGLTWTNPSEITPGILTAIAHDYYSSGVDAAKKRCRDTAAMFERMANGENIATSV